MRLLALALTAAGLALVGSAGMASTKTTILPGQWEYVSKLGPFAADTESRCLKPADVEQFAKGICTRRYTCDYQTRVVENGKITLNGTWTDKKKGRAWKIAAKGTYTPESFKLSANGIASISAKRTNATCLPE